MSGAAKLYVSRLKEGNKTLLLSEWKPIFKNGEYYRPVGLPTVSGMDIPDFFPKLEVGDEPIEVKVVECKEETGLWLTAEDGYYGNELWIYNTKPVLKEEGKNKSYDFEGNENSWLIHIANEVIDTNLKSYEEIRNIKLIKSGN